MSPVKQGVGAQVPVVGPPVAGRVDQDVGDVLGIPHLESPGRTSAKGL